MSSASDPSYAFYYLLYPLSVAVPTVSREERLVLEPDKNERKGLIFNKLFQILPFGS